MVSVGQPKLETILEKGDMHITRHGKYKVWSMKLNNQVPHDHNWTIRPKLSPLMYNVYANVGLFGHDVYFLFFCRRFFCSHCLHVLEILYPTAIALVKTWAHHDTFWRPANPNNRRMSSSSISIV